MGGHDDIDGDGAIGHRVRIARIDEPIVRVKNLDLAGRYLMLDQDVLDGHRPTEGEFARVFVEFGHSGVAPDANRFGLLSLRRKIDDLLA